MIYFYESNNDEIGLVYFKAGFTPTDYPRQQVKSYF